MASQRQSRVASCPAVFLKQTFREHERWKDEEGDRHEASQKNNNKKSSLVLSSSSLWSIKTHPYHKARFLRNLSKNFLISLLLIPPRRTSCECKQQRAKHIKSTFSTRSHKNKDASNKKAQSKDDLSVKGLFTRSDLSALLTLEGNHSLAAWAILDGGFRVEVNFIIETRGKRICKLAEVFFCSRFESSTCGQNYLPIANHRQLSSVNWVSTLFSWSGDGHS